MDKYLETVKARARRVYEITRIRLALWTLVPAMLFGVCGFGLCSTPVLSLGGAILTGFFAILFLWKGNEYGKAVLPALVIGSIGVILPGVAHATGLCCRFDLEMMICGGVGLLMGFLHGYAPARNNKLGFKYLFSGAVLLCLAGGIGCSYLGLVGLAGVAVGVLVASTVTYLALRPRT